MDFVVIEKNQQQLIRSADMVPTVSAISCIVSIMA